MQVKTTPIVVEKMFSVSSELLWQAITKPNKMRQWFFDNIPDFEAKEGFYTEFRVSSGERDFLHQWRIVAVQPLALIRYHWTYGGYEGESYVSFLLTEDESSCTLTIKHEGITSFPQDIPEFRPESCQAGWQYFTEELKRYLGSC